jgi:hypothetical protein
MPDESYSTYGLGLWGATKSCFCFTVLEPSPKLVLLRQSGLTKGLQLDIGHGTKSPAIQVR